MKLFVQNSLLNGDFRRIQNFISIPFSSIYTTIENGEYHTELSHIKKSFSSLRGSDYATEIKGFYVFSKNSFYKLSLQAFQQNGEKNQYEFGGIAIQIDPAFIPTTEFEQMLRPLGQYLDVIKDHYTDNVQNLKIDLNSHTVSIDSSSFPVSIN